MSDGTDAGVPVAGPAVVVGAGQAGAHAALAIRQAGFAGRILLVGDEAERPHERPPLSKEVLLAPAEPPVSYFHPEDHYPENGVEVMLGVRAEAIDPAARVVCLSNGTEVGYGGLVLATGGSARRLDIPGAERVMYLRTLDDARLLRGRLRPGARVVCIGAGVIGLEIASSARARGCTVTVVEAGPSVMGRSLPPEMAAWLAGVHQAAGVELRLGTGVGAVTADAVVLADGEAIPADAVVAGIGMTRNTALAEAAGIAVADGIEVDEFGHTSMAGIYAAGDVAAFWVPRLHRRLRLETWRHAQEHGTAVGRALAGVRVPYDPLPWFWTDQHGRNLQVAGLPSGPAVWRGEPGGGPFSAWFLHPDGTLAGVAGVDSPREVRAAQALIKRQQPVDPRLIADLSVTPQRLAKV